MGFQLVIAEGKEAGREFVFEQSSVVIGRTSECDIVLYDPGVSRKHARIFAEGEGYFVEDMGSSNGTKVNGSVIQKHQLADGDAVQLGPVVFKFAGLELAVEVPLEPTADGAVASESTRIVSADSLRKKVKATALAPVDADPRALEEIERRNTHSLEAIAKPRSSGAAVARPDRSPPRDGKLSAAERARIRRESRGPIGALKVFWIESGPGARTGAVVAAAVVLLAAVALPGYFWWARAGGPTLGPEPSVLTNTPIEASFGLGDGVSYERPDRKVFGFEFNAAADAVVALQFQARDIEDGEVQIIVNGTPISTVPPDTLVVNERSHEVLIPKDQLKKGEMNQVEFDNLKNPPDRQTWRIWNVRVETNLLPILPAEQLAKEADEAFRRGQQYFDRRDIGAGNRYQAYKEFRNAWLMLESRPEVNPELQLLARDKMKQAQSELERICSQLMLQAAGEYNQRQYAAARATLDHVREYFPANDQPCPWLADQKRAEYDL